MTLYRNKLIILFVFLSLIFFNNCVNKKNTTNIIPEVSSKVNCPKFYISKTKVYPGDFVLIYIFPVNNDQKITIFSSVLETIPKFYPYKKGKMALLPISYHSKPGKYLLNLKIELNNNKFIKLTKEVDIISKKFDTQYLKVTPSQQTKRNPELWKEDYRKIKKAKSVSNTTPFWKGKFIIPTQGRISTEYGTKRFINNVESGRHSGLDIASPLDSPVKAANNGVVVLSTFLNVTGNTIIIDHGLNLFSSYAHLNKLCVKKGQYVKKGDTIGLIGSTGFSTGPHLHWTTSIGITFTNPRLLLNQDPLEHLNKSP